WGRAARRMGEVRGMTALRCDAETCESRGGSSPRRNSARTCAGAGRGEERGNLRGRQLSADSRRGEEHGRAGVEGVGGDDVERAVAVEVGGGEVHRPGADVEAGDGDEVLQAEAGDDDELAPGVIDGDELGRGVAVEVGGDDGVEA